MGTVKLQPITRASTWQSVTWTQLGRRNSLFLLPGDAWHDNNGYVRFFSLQTPTRASGVINCKLLPRNEATDMILDITSEWLVDVGLELVGSAIYSGDKLIVNVAQALAQEFAGLTIKKTTFKASVSTVSPITMS